ncbi:MAG: sporulation protein YunB [Clostridia bacterium]|nr:sporulation protein YunB [Clostridia bacterium]
MVLYVTWSQYLKKNIEDQVFSQSVSVVKSRAVDAANFAANSTITDSLKYNDYVEVVKDKEDNIILIQAKTMQVNRLARQLALNCKESIDNIGEHNVEIPIGAFSGFILFANYGRKIDIPLTIYSTASAEYLSSFNAVGINQTRHSIYIIVNINMDIVLPLYSYPINFNTYVLVAESVIVGKIPDVYINASDYKEFLDLIPN